MKLILKLLSTIALTSLPVTITGCTNIIGEPCTYNVAFKKINKFEINTINLLLPVMDFKLYKSDVIFTKSADIPIISNNFPADFEQQGFIKIQIANKEIFNDLLSVYALDKSTSKEKIKSSLNHCPIIDGKINITKYPTYSNFFYLNSLSGQLVKTK